MRSFLDTNVLVYAFDEGQPEKQRRAQNLLASGDPIVLSTQVLQEFYVVVQRKMARSLSSEEAEAAVRGFAALPTIQVDTRMVLAAIRRGRSLRISLWDALILEAALASGAERLFTEDLQDGQIVDGLTVVNPFA